MTGYRFGQILAWQTILMLPAGMAVYLWGWGTGIFVYFLLGTLGVFFTTTADQIVKAIRMGPLG